MHHGNGLLDISELYASIGWLQLGRVAMRLDFPVEVLGLELLQCMAARCLRIPSPLCPVVQGLRGRIRFATCATYHIMQRFTTAHVRMSQRLWLDDIQPIGHML
eukprot:2804017-Pyramimonas_sp.AAC.1